MSAKADRPAREVGSGPSVGPAPTSTARCAVPRLETRGLTRILDSGGRPLTVLRDVDLAVPAGQFLAILGPSGSGKSTLLGLLAGLDRPTAGEVLLDGQVISTLSEDRLARLRRDRVGFVFQSFHLLRNLTALENVMLPLELIGVADVRERARDLLAEVGLADRGHHYPSQLSGGEQQRVALARAFVHRPSLLLADEPTGNLDSRTGEAVLEILVRLRRDHGATLVLVTHDTAVAGRADRQVHFHDGEVVEDRTDRRVEPPA